MIRGHRRDEPTTQRVITLDGSDRETGMTAALITSVYAGAESAGATPEHRRLSDRTIAFGGGCRASSQRLIERLIGEAEWPWGRPAPRPRPRPHPRRPAV